MHLNVIYIQGSFSFSCKIHSSETQSLLYQAIDFEIAVLSGTRGCSGLTFSKMPLRN